MGKLLSRYRTPLVQYLEERGLARDDAEDVVQQVLLEICSERILEAADRSKGRFRTLLLRITQYVSASEFRKHYAQKRGGGKAAVSWEELAEATLPPAEEKRFNDLWAKNLIQMGLERLQKEAAHLKVPYYEVLVMKCLKKNSYKEIAQQLQCTESDVANYVRNGKARLKKHLMDLATEYCSSPDEHEEELALLQQFIR